MLRESEFQTEYGLIAAGAVNSSFIGLLPGKARALGPVAGVSYRVASRIRNTLRAGVAARSVKELDSVRLILFYAPPSQHGMLLGMLREASIAWAGKSLIFCDSDPGGTDDFRIAGASISTLRTCALPGRMIVQGTNPSLAFTLRMVRSLRMKPIQIEPGSAAALDAAITLATGALTPLIDQSAALLRQCGLRDSEAMKLAAALFERTARDYSHSGRQSWAWYAREPDVEEVIRQIGAVRGDLRPAVCELMLSGLRELGRHPEIAERIREALKKSS
ncbi:MAG: DUF2520 domain-containing protein [Acidobacteriota bacterium]|nr:DUF2520 domain-containing protein [Acidobacteriota bacterium]